MQVILRFVARNCYMLGLAALIGALAFLPVPKPAVAGGLWCCVSPGETCDTDCQGGPGNTCHQENETNCDPPKPGS